jgi:tetratricopeptide (TPR) repeat protein
MARTVAQRRFLWNMSVIALLVCCVACSRDPKARKAGYLKSGDSYVQQGKFAEAIIQYRNAVQADPLDGEARLKLAEAYYKNQDGTNAAREYVRAADVLTNRVDVQLRAGTLLLIAGRFDDAKVRAEKALAVSPQEVEAHVLLGNALAGLRNLDGAVAEIEEAIRLAPERASSYSNLGELEARRGRPDAAEKALKKGVELDDRSAAAHLALVNFYWAREQRAEAEQELSKALALDPNNVAAHRAMATLAIALNRPEEAEAHLKKIIELTKSPEASVALSDFYILRRDEAAARKVLDPLAEGTQPSADAMVRLAAMDRTAGRSKEAYARLDSILARDKTHLQALLSKSAMLLDDGKLEDAFAAADLAVKSHAESAEAQYTLGRVQAARNQNEPAIAAFKEALRINPRAAGAHVALAQLSLKAGRASEAVGFAQDALTSNPRNPDARLALARGLMARGELQRAETELQQLTKQFPNSAAIHLQNGMLQGRKKNLPGARKEFDEALKLEPNSMEALEASVALDLAMKQPEAARARVKGRIDAPNASPALMLLAARTYVATGDVETGEQLMRKALQKDSTYLPAYGALSQLYLSQKRLDAALVELDNLARQDPKPVAALTLAGTILLTQGKTAEARQRFEKALEVDPSAAVAANNLAWIYGSSGENLDKALELAQTAYSKLPNSPEVGDTLGFIYYKKDLLPQAIDILKAAVEKDPNRADYHYHLGLALAKNGDKAGATEHLNRALAIRPDFDGAADAKSVLSSLGSTGSPK